MINPAFVDKLKTATTPEEVQQLFAAAEAQQEAEALAEEQAASVAAETTSERPYLVAVTACPTGIAHTYMAEDALKKKAKELGIDIKVETNGSEGIKNRLTEADIARAAGVIVAADKKVEMDRCDGKHLVNRPVSDGIRKTEQLINEALRG